MPGVLRKVTCDVQAKCFFLLAVMGTALMRLLITTAGGTLVGAFGAVNVCPASFSLYPESNGTTTLNNSTLALSGLRN